MIRVSIHGAVSASIPTAGRGRPPEADEDVCATGRVLCISPPTGKQVEDPYDEGGANDRPEDRKVVPADPNHEGLRQLHLARHPQPEHGSDEAEGSRSDAAAPSPAGDGLADGTADGRDDEEEDEPWQRERHGQVPFEEFAGVLAPRQGNIDAREVRFHHRDAETTESLRPLRLRGSKLWRPRWMEVSEMNASSPVKA